MAPLSKGAVFCLPEDWGLNIKRRFFYRPFCLYDVITTVTHIDISESINYNIFI